MTPTGWARDGGRSLPPQLGSTRAVIKALAHHKADHPGTPVALVVGHDGRALAEAIKNELRIAMDIIPASGCPNVLWTFATNYVIGVDVDAFRGIMAAQWTAAQATLVQRFARIIWG